MTRERTARDAWLGVGLGLDRVRVRVRVRTAGDTRADGAAGEEAEGGAAHLAEHAGGERGPEGEEET